MNPMRRIHSQFALMKLMTTTSTSVYETRLLLPSCAGANGRYIGSAHGSRYGANRITPERRHPIVVLPPDWQLPSRL